MGARNRVGIWLSYRPARQHSLAELIPWNRFFGTQPENGFHSCFIGTRNTEHCKQNITCTFDPRTLSCLTCKLEHPVLEAKGGSNTPVTLVLSDQSFPPAVEVGEGGNCLRIVRIEDGLLGEIADLALELFPRGLPENSIVLVVLTSYVWAAAVIAVPGWSVIGNCYN
jgi:hypothetical protein